MKLKKWIGVAALLCMIGCATNYRTDVIASWVDKATVEDMDDDKIEAPAPDMEAMKKDKKKRVMVEFSFTNDVNSKQRARFDAENVRRRASGLFRDYLTNVKAYKVYYKDNLKTGGLQTSDELSEPRYDFKIEGRVQLNTEVEERYDLDEIMYKCEIAWTLVNCQGDAPEPMFSMNCKGIEAGKGRLSSVSHRNMGGADAENARNKFANAVKKACVAFEAQLARRVAFGGKISRMYMRDGNVRFDLRSGSDSGLRNRMQMVVLNRRGEYFGVGQVALGAENTSSITMYRWLSKDLKKEIMRNVEEKEKAKAYLKDEDTELFAVAMGIPTPDKDEDANAKDYD